MENLLYFIVSLFKRKKSVSVNQTRFLTGDSKTVMTSCGSLELTQKTEQKKQKINEEIEDILYSCKYNPKTILKYIAKHGTRIYKIPLASKILKIIGEEEGFIAPRKGLQALILNLFLGLYFHKKIVVKFSTPSLYLLGEDAFDIYGVVYHFHKWYSYKKKLPGFDSKSQNSLRKYMKKSSSVLLDDCEMQEVFDLQEAINRDKEAINFMTKFAQNSEKLKKTMEKITKGEKVAI